MKMLTGLKPQPTGRVPLMTLGLLMILSGCADPTGSATSATICRELSRDLPTYSRSDTPETLASGARFVGVFEAVCE